MKKPTPTASTALDLARTVDPEPDFPLDAFPPEVAAWLDSSAQAARVPVALVATPFLAATGAVIGNQLALQVGPGWIERPTLWVALVTLTGVGKSPALAIVRRPLQAIQQEAIDHWQPTLTAWQRLPYPRPPRPSPPHLLVTASTTTAIGHALVQAPGVLVLRDELYGLFRALDRNLGVERQHFLSLWSGDPLTLDCTDAVSLIPAPVVGVIGGIQPALIAGLRRRAQDGLLERFLLVYSEGIVPPWDPETPEPFGESLITDLLRTLRTCAPETPVTVTWSPEAAALWSGWFTTNLDRVLQTHLVLRGFYRKLPTHLARIALVLHALWHPSEPATPLSAATIQHAIALVECLTAHIHRAATLFGVQYKRVTSSHALSSRIVTTLMNQPPESPWLARTTLLRAVGRPESEYLDQVLAHLSNVSIIQARTVPTAGRTLTEYRVHPSRHFSP